MNIKTTYNKIFVFICIIILLFIFSYYLFKSSNSNIKKIDYNSGVKDLGTGKFFGTVKDKKINTTFNSGTGGTGDF